MSNKWKVIVYCPAGSALMGEVAGIFDEVLKQQAVILGGPDGVSEEDIKRAQFITRACNSHDALLSNLKAAENWIAEYVGCWDPGDADGEGLTGLMQDIQLAIKNAEEK